MGDINRDRPDDSNMPRHEPDSVAEETSATGHVANLDAAGAIAASAASPFPEPARRPWRLG